MCYEQPQPLRPPSISVLTVNAFRGDEPTFDGTRQTIRKSEQPPSLSPLDLGEKPWFGFWPHQNNQNTLPIQNQRPNISAPYSFRRLDHTDAQRHGLVPLRLGPVVLRESPITQDDGTVPPKPVLNRAYGYSDSTEDLLVDDTRPRSYRANRESPFQRCQQQSSTVRPMPCEDIPVEVESQTADSEEPAPAKPPWSKRSSSRSPCRQGVETPTSSIKSRTSSERVRPKRKRSFPLVRKDGNDRLEQEILELNTIVEERRTETGRDNPPRQHVPAVAPLMLVPARSETLDAIGSALSRPLATHNAQPDVGSSNTTTPERPYIRRSTSSSSWASSRLSGWLSGFLPSSSPAHLPRGEPFYKCQPRQQQRRTYSEASTWTSLTEAESPSLTATSSPVSHGHSRNFTDESRITPLSPSILPRGMHSRGMSKTHKENQWPFMTTPTAEVGLAL